MTIGEAKIVFVTAEVKNITDRKINIGYNTTPASPCDFWIKGSEGSEQGSAQKNRFAQDIKTGAAVTQASNLPRYIKDSFPQNALVSPNGSVKGKIMFAVPVWLKPTVFFRKAKLGDKAYEIIIQLSK